MMIPKKQMLFAVVVLVFLIAVSVFWIMQNTNNNLNDSENQNQILNQTDRHPFIKIIKLIKPDCRECSSLDFLVEAIKTEFDLNVLEVKEVDSNSEEGQNLIKMHEIKKLPSLIVNGEFQGTELQQLWPNIGKEKNGVLILTYIEPPYFSLEENRVVGLINFLLIEDSSCNECEDLSLFIDYIKDLNVFIDQNKTLEYTSPEAQKLIDYYFISSIPAVILTGDVLEYEYFYYIWIQGGGYDEENALIYEEAVPFVDLDSGEIKGLVKITRLVDENCFDCIDSNVLVELLISQMRLKVIEDKTLNVSSFEGQKLIEKYSITKIPTIIVSQEAELYNEFLYAWDSAGTQEEDGNFVFRNFELIEGKLIELN